MHHPAKHQDWKDDLADALIECAANMAKAGIRRLGRWLLGRRPEKNPPRSN